MNSILMNNTRDEQYSETVTVVINNSPFCEYGALGRKKKKEDEGVHVVVEIWIKTYHVKLWKATP